MDKRAFSNQRRRRRRPRVILLPTRTCFDDAVEIMKRMVDLRFADVTRGVIRIVHGIVEDKSGRQFAHAWVEGHFHCYELHMLGDQKIMSQFTMEEHLAHLKRIKTTSYSYDEAYYEERKHGRPGPWVPEYQALTRDGIKASGDIEKADVLVASEVGVKSVQA